MGLPRLGFGQASAMTEEKARFIRQLGVEDVVIHLPDLPAGDGFWKYEDLAALRRSVEEKGLRLAAIENVPFSFYDKIMLGKPGRDEQLDRLKKTLTNMGKAGIPVLGYHFMPDGVWRTNYEVDGNEPPVTDYLSGATVPVGRGGADVTAFNEAFVAGLPLSRDREYGEEEMWENFEYFLRAVIPAAEEAGVRMALHPNDPPVEKIAGIPQLFRSFEAFKRMIELVPSEFNGLEFCQGTWAEMGEDVFEAIDYFGRRNRIVYVHFRNVTGSVPQFRETFIDEGDVDMFAAVKAYRDAGFDGVMIPDHVPVVVGDEGWSFRGRANAIGYMRGLLDALR